MGQMTSAVIFGVDAGVPPESLGDEGWSELLDRYKAGKGPRPDHPSGDSNNYDVIGFWVAVGATGRDGRPNLDKGFPLDDFLSVPEYRKSYQRAFKAWERFAQWAAVQGYAFGTPRLWFVRTEVA